MVVEPVLVAGAQAPAVVETVMAEPGCLTTVPAKESGALATALGA